MGEKKSYKDYPFPTGLLIVYLIFIAGGVFLSELLFSFIFSWGYVKGFFDGLIVFAIMLVGFGIICFVFNLLFMFISSFVEPSGIYKGLGLKKFAKVINGISIVAFIVMTVVLYLISEPSMLNIGCLLLEFAFPIVMYVFLVKNVLSDNYCEYCGLVNSYSITNYTTEDLGREHKFHNEGGHYETTGNYHIGRYKYYVPKTTVYDGIYEKKRTNSEKTCKVCGHVKRNSYETETKV